MAFYKLKWKAVAIKQIPATFWQNPFEMLISVKQAKEDDAEIFKLNVDTSKEASALSNQLAKDRS